MTNRWATDIPELKNIDTWLLSTFKSPTSWYCVINALTVSWSVVVISVRLGTGTGLVMVHRAMMMGWGTRKRDIMVIVMVMMVGWAVRENGAQRMKRFLRLLSQPKANANAKGEWKSKGRP